MAYLVYSIKLNTGCC